MKQEEQQFLNDLDKKLWTAANKLLPMLDAAVYKHVVLGLIFLKYVSDAFKERREELQAAFTDPKSDYYLGEDAADLIAEIPFKHHTLKAKDILGHVYEYFLGQFAIAEGKKGGQYYTPKSIVTTIVEMLEPYKGRVYDPCCGSGGFFVSSEELSRNMAASWVTSRYMDRNPTPPPGGLPQ